MEKIGFIGIGVMGKSIVGHLLQAGYEVSVYNRTKSKTDELVHKGAVWQDSPKDVANHSDVIFSMVGYPQDVEEIYFGKNGIFEANLQGKLIGEMTTSQPSLAVRIYDEAQKVGAAALDAPVSGGDLGAQNATLTVMIGGDLVAFNKILPILEVFSKNQYYHGGAGCGQHAKMANQIMIAGTMTGMMETLVYANAAGLDLEKVMDTLGGGAAQNWSLTNYGPRVLREDYSPGFFVKHYIKDLGIALDESTRMGIDLPGTKLAKKLYDELADLGHANDGTQALIKLWWKDGKRV